MSATTPSAAQLALARARAQRATQTYQQAQTMTVAPGQLIIQLYDGAIRFLRRARAALADNDIELTHNSLCRVQDIMVELDSTLDDRAGEISNNLHQIYLYCYQRLALANAEKNDAIMGEILVHLENMAEAWRGAIASLTVATVPVSGRIVDAGPTLQP